MHDLMIMKNAEIDDSLINEVIDIVTHERDRWESSGANRRKDEICYIYDMDYYKDYDKFLAVYGGEFVEYGLHSYVGNGSLEKYRQVIKLGHPYVVEFAIPVHSMSIPGIQDVARFMLEEWIHLDLRKDETQHQYDGRIEFEIPPENIIEVHEVEDSFPEWDDYMF
jgi:hypothetical protein